MPSEDSKVHKERDYWNVSIHRRTGSGHGREGDHILVRKGSREIQIFTNSLDIRHISNNYDFSKDEIAELKDIAKKYR